MYVYVNVYLHLYIYIYIYIYINDSYIYIGLKLISCIARNLNYINNLATMCFKFKLTKK